MVDLPAGRQAREQNMEYFVYVIKSQNKNYTYIGQTTNLIERLTRHNSGREKTTKSYRPFKLIHVELADSRKEARSLEKYFKSGFGRENVSQIADVAKLVHAHA